MPFEDPLVLTGGGAAQPLFSVAEPVSAETCRSDVTLDHDLRMHGHGLGLDTGKAGGCGNGVPFRGRPSCQGASAIVTRPGEGVEPFVDRSPGCQPSPPIAEASRPGRLWTFPPRPNAEPGPNRPCRWGPQVLVKARRQRQLGEGIASVGLEDGTPEPGRFAGAAD